MMNEERHHNLPLRIYFSCLLFNFITLFTDVCMTEKIMKEMEEEKEEVERIKKRRVEVMREWILNTAVSKRFPFSW